MAIGAILFVFGLFVMLLGKMGLFRLPGDISFGGRHWRIYFPIASSILLSILLTLLLWLISHFRR